MSWETLSSEELIGNRWVTVRKDRVRLSNGEIIDDFYAVTVSNSAGIVAITEKGEILLKKEYRYTCGEELIEFPAGTFEPDEKDPLAVAQRELLEETGYVSDHWTYLGATVEDAAKLTNRIHLFLAEDCRKVSDLKLDATEVIEVMRIPFEQAVEMVMNNEICCNSSAHAILKVAKLLEGKRQG